jgi:hypothetical protein
MAAAADGIHWRGKALEVAGIATGHQECRLALARLGRGGGRGGRGGGNSFMGMMVFLLVVILPILIGHHVPSSTVHSRNYIALNILNVKRVFGILEWHFILANIGKDLNYSEDGHQKSKGE